METPVIDTPSILSLGLSMVTVVAAVLALGWLYSRLRLTPGGTSELINVKASRALGPKERLLIVEVADQTLLIGMTATQVQTLHAFDKPVDSIEGLARTHGFAERLRGMLRGSNK